jgi:hypothetical protein
VADESLLIFDNGSGLTLTALGQPGSEDFEDFKADKLELSGTAAAGTVTQTLKIPSSFDIPRKLLRQDAGRLVFRTKDELETLAHEEWAALRERLRRRLAQPFEVSLKDTDTLFALQKIAGVQAEARLWLAPEILDGPKALNADAVVLRAEAGAALDLDLNLAAGGATASLKGRWRVDLEVRKAAIDKAVQALFAIDLPTLPAFNLDWPRFSLPNLTFAGCAWPALGTLPSLFAIALPPFATKLKFVPDKPVPNVQVSLTGGDVSFANAQPASGKLNYDGTKICDISGVTLSYNSATKKHAFTAALSPAPFNIGPTPLEFPPPGVDFPFSIKIAALSTTITFSDVVIDSAAGVKAPSATLAHTLKSVKIAATEDPSLFIVLDAMFETSVQAGGGISTKLTKLQIVEPYPVELIANVAKAAVEAAGELIRLISAIPLPKSGLPGIDVQKLAALLGLLGRMLAAAMTWLAKRAGVAAGLLAGAVEAVAKLLGQLLDSLAQAAADMFKVVCIEVRLDPQTYHIRQIVLTPANDVAIGKTLNVSALGFDLHLDAKAKPSLLIDFGPESWFGLIVEPDGTAGATLKTDLWLDKETGPQQPLGSLGEKDGATSGADHRLIKLTAVPGSSGGGASMPRRDIVVAAVQHGRLRLFQKFVTVGAGRAQDVQLETGSAKFKITSKHQSAKLEPATIGENAATDDIVLSYETGDIKGRILALLPKSESGSSGGGFGEMLSQKIEIDSGTPKFNSGDQTLSLGLKVKVHLGDNFSPETELQIGVDLRDLSMKITGGDRISIKSLPGQGTRHYRPLGFDLEVRKKKDVTTDQYEQFYLDLSSGGEKLGLGREADAFLSYDRVASAGKGLQFELSEFAIGRSGIDLEARIKPDPVRLGGVDMPFTFTSGQVSIKGSRFGGGSLTGSGQLPKKLIGEANASIALTLARGPSGDVVVEAATALIDKSGDPIKCHSTRFDLTITELGFGFVMEESYHFYFLVTGSARFNPGQSEFARGLLKNFNAIEIRFDKAPLTSDPRVLMRSISFLVKLKPPKVMKLFDIFKFELRSIAFYPAHDKFGGDAAMGFGGQVNFLGSGDRVSIQVNIHEVLIAAPLSGQFLPRIRFDGLSVVISLSGVKVGGTAITVDGDLPSLYRPNILPKNISAHGFLASGTLEVQGWAPMSATMGFLELKNKDNPADRPRHAFFFYGQMSKMSEPIDTPIGTIYLREVGFGFGYRYTLAGIAQAQRAQTPQELIKILDEVSKYQGSLDRFEAWEPTYDDADLTLALRGMLALSAAQRTSKEYKEKTEATLPNPLLFDIVAALRTDLTVLINLRAWLCVNYHKWATDGADEEWKRNPVFRGYLYFSAPKREFLGRFISNRNGYIGEHPPMPEPLKTALRSSDFAATLYIRPGLFHFELGWPYELGFELGKPGDTFYLAVRGGMIYRVEDFSVLQGIAFKAHGEVHLEGRIGSDSFGAAAVAHATFDLESRVLSYLSLRNFDESMYYGYLRIDILIDARIEVWLSFKIFGKRIRLSAGFSIHLAVSLAIEGVISPKGLGGKAHASVGIRAFGRTASVGIGFSFNNGLLDQARARVAGFMALGLSTPIPDKSQDGRRIENNPPPQPPRHEAAAIADQTIDQDLGSAPAPEVEQPKLVGLPIGQTNFWAMLFPTSYTDKAGEWYVMQFVPRDHTPHDDDPKNKSSSLAKYATFFASPKKVGDDVQTPWHVLRGTNALKDKNAIPEEFLYVPITGTTAAVNWDQDYLINGKGAVGAEGDVALEALLFDLFLDPDPDHGGNLTEPRPRSIELHQSKLEDDGKASAATLARHGRSRVDLPAKSKREAQIEEARSAILASVVDSAVRLAGQGLTSSALPTRHAEIDARDFGLTFLVSRAALYKLFPELEELEKAGDVSIPPVADFKVGKSDTSEAGNVYLFNPPSRMFREAQPRFTPKHVITDQGVMLDWDLEPSWGQSLGAYHDPEFHLRHYRVRRTIRGLEQGEYRAEFVAKAVAPTQLTNGKKVDDGSTVTMLRPPFQFIDDLRQAGADSSAVAIPEALRDALLGNGDRQALDAINVKPGDIGKVDILYEIVPVDIAGTSDFGEPYVVPIPAMLEPLPVSPRQAVLQLVYEPPGSPKPPVPRFLFTPKSEEKTLALHLRILTEYVESLGSYGTDALDQAGRFDERSIERLKGSDVAEFVLNLKVTNNSSGPFVFQNEDRDLNKSAAAKKDAAEVSEESKDLAPGYFDGTVQMLKGNNLAPVKFEKILAALDADDASIMPGRVRRLFVRRLAAAPTDLEDLYKVDRHGEWRSMPVNLVLERARPEPDDGKPLPHLKKPAPISTILETFEQPVDLEFMALSTQGGDANCESGRLHLIYPPFEKGTLDDLAPDEGSKNGTVLPTLRDPARRSAIRLSWKVNARGLKLTPTDVADKDRADLYRWIGGYDVHVIDPDAVPALPPDAPDEQVRAQLIEAAKPVGQVALMPASFDGLEPSGFGDFGRLEAAYPSETLRLLCPPKDARASGVRRAGWYSPAESTAIFPQPSIRRSLMADPDEALIASLFAQGRPDALRISIPGWLDKGADPLPNWNLAAAGQHGRAFGEYEDASIPRDHDDTASKIALYQSEEGFKVAEVRRLLQNLRLVPVGDNFTDAYLQETEALARRIDDPTHLAAVAVRIEAQRALRDADNKSTSKFVVVAKVDHAVDLAPPMHPVLADALAFLPYMPQNGNVEEVTDGSIYRRYSIVADPDPEVKAKTFADWLDETPPERDPHGWGALRTLGLARGLRIYDSVTGEYLRGHKLLRRVRAAMKRALMRYRDTTGAGQERRFNGQPFVDLLTKPWGNAKLFWFDGGGEGLSPKEQAEVVNNETLAVVQIALRPAPDRLVPGAAPQDLQRACYFAINVSTSDKGKKRPEWRLRLKTLLPGRHVDLLSLSGGIEANPAVRLETDVVHAFRVSGRVLQDESAIAVVRVTLLDASSFGKKQVTDALVLEKVEVTTDGSIGGAEEVPWSLDEIGQPVVLQKKQSGPPDLAFGKFEPLKAPDWADALFRPAPSPDDNRPFTLSPIPAFGTLACYLARRFGRITLAQGNPVSKGVESEAARAARAEVAAAIVRFWTRFLDHCAPAVVQPDTIYFSIGTVADPGVWRRAPDPSGSVSIVIPELERRGGRRKFAIRPYGRYASWIKALAAPGSEDDPRPGLEDALDKTGFAEQFLDVTLPRTEPLEKPVVLSATRRAPAAHADDVGRTEIVVAHGTDMVLAQANTRNLAMLAPIGISVGYRREFPHNAWLYGLPGIKPGDPDYNPLASFGSPEGDGNAALPALDEAEAETRLVELRKLVPDAWLGSTLISAASLPYFFRTHARVHLSAGIVVSETTRVVFEEGFAELYFPHTTKDGYTPRSQSVIPTYGVTREKSDLTITFDLALHRFVDCMRPREAELWFGKSGQHWTEIENVAHLPEPGISYRISIEASIPGTGEVVSRAGEFDLLPTILVTKKTATEEKKESRYLLQSTGQLLKAKGHTTGEQFSVKPQEGSGPNWRLQLATVPCKPGAFKPFSREVGGDLLTQLHARLEALANAGAGETQMIDALCHYTVTCNWDPSPADWAPLLLKAKEALGTAPEAMEILRQWENPPPKGAKLSLPLSYLARHFKALDRLNDLCKSPPQPEAQELLLVRPLPSDDDLRNFKPVAAPTPVETELWELLLRVAAEQLFGPGRQPVVSATKGTMAPLHHPIVRRI